MILLLNSLVVPFPQNLYLGNLASYAPDAHMYNKHQNLLGIDPSVLYHRCHTAEEMTMSAQNLVVAANPTPVSSHLVLTEYSGHTRNPVTEVAEA